MRQPREDEIKGIKYICDFEKGKIKLWKIRTLITKS